MEGRIVKGIWFPIEIWEAEDLSWNEKILLMEIDSYTTKGKDCFISDEYISKMLKVSERTAATMISNLFSKGYIKKTKFDGRKRYLESTLAEQLCKNCRAEMQNLQTTNNTITNNNSHIHENIYIEKANGKFDFYQALLEMGVQEQVAKDWLKVRKEAKAANTETAFKGLQREIAKSGLTANECVTIAAENSWRGFKCRYLGDGRTVRPAKETNFQKLMREGREMFGGFDHE